MDLQLSVHYIYGASSDLQTTRLSDRIYSTPVAMANTALKATSIITVDSTDFTGDNAAKLTALENALYGTDSTEPYLPTPDNVLALLTTGKDPNS